MLHLYLTSVRFELDVSKALGRAGSDAVSVVISDVLVGFSLETLRHYRVDNLTVDFSSRVRLLRNELQRIVKLIEARGSFHFFNHLSSFFILVSLSIRSVRLVLDSLRVEGQFIVERV